MRMPITSIIAEIDAEIARLEQARTALSSIGENPKESPPASQEG